ncbi:MAG TPA: DUF3786 domain-containing protein [Desulfohalobiaceae bacterium]|nr:DUF3786 domain-containing protein [Desulfohalobiaceae bacterium]
MEKVELSQAFQEVYDNYLKQIAEIDLANRAPLLGGQIEDQEMILPLLARSFRISSAGIVTTDGARPIHAESVVLSKYVLMCSEQISQSKEWVSYKDFKDAAPFAGAYTNNVEKAIAKNFQGRLSLLKSACDELQGQKQEVDFSYQLIRRFQALPCLSLLLLFNDVDEEFPAESKVLFPNNAADYLDMECLAILGWLLSDYLNLAAGGTRMSIM